SDSTLTTLHTLTPATRFSIDAPLGAAFIDIKSHQRILPMPSSYYVVIDSVVTGGDADFLLQTSVHDPSAAGSSNGIRVKWPPANDATRCCHFLSDGSSTASVHAGFGIGATSTDITSTYDFRELDTDGLRTLPGLIVGGNIVITAVRLATTAPFTNVLAIEEITGSGHVDVLTNGYITVDEVTSDLQVGRIRSTANDVILYSPAKIVDQLNDPSPANEADVTGKNITMCAGTARPDALEARTAADAQCAALVPAAPLGGIGTQANFLEINVDVLNSATPGVLRAYDTFATSTAGVYLTETVNDMKVHTVDTKGDSSLVTLGGSIVDARGGAGGENTAPLTFNVRANNIWLDANGGSVGTPAGTPDATGNDLKIDSGHLVSSIVGIEADASIYLTEVIGALDLRLAQALAGGIRLTVQEDTGAGGLGNPGVENLNLLQPTGTILVVENAPRTIPHGLINAPAGFILLRVGDNITLGNTAPIASSISDPAGNTQVLAGQWIDIFGDFGWPSNELDTEYGTVMTLHGTITPGTLTSVCANNINPAPRTCNITRIFGNRDADTFNFEQTYLGGKTRA